jgi:hypothetical protein
LVEPAGGRALTIASVLLGELIDRGEYYAELESESPRRRMGIDLEEQISAYPVADQRLVASAGD